MRATSVLTFAILTSLLLGCGDSPQLQVASDNVTPISTSPGGTVAANDEFQAVRPAKVYNSPQESVQDFLTAVTTGDDATATALLTTQAQRETWRNGLALTSEGFPGAQFQVTEVEQLSPTEAHVQTNWIDEKQDSYPCVWLLRKESHGWCIFGMATKFMENADPVILPFEDHKLMAQRQSAAIRQMQQYQLQQQTTQQRLGGQQASQIGTRQPTDTNVRQASGTSDFR